MVQTCSLLSQETSTLLRHKKTSCLYYYIFACYSKWFVKAPSNKKHGYSAACSIKSLMSILSWPLKRKNKNKIKNTQNKLQAAPLFLTNDIASSHPYHTSRYPESVPPQWYINLDTGANLTSAHVLHKAHHLSLAKKNYFTILNRGPGSGASNLQFFQFFQIPTSMGNPPGWHIWHLPFGERENHLQKCLARGYVSCLEGNLMIAVAIGAVLFLCHP